MFFPDTLVDEKNSVLNHLVFTALSVPFMLLLSSVFSKPIADYVAGLIFLASAICIYISSFFVQGVLKIPDTTEEDGFPAFGGAILIVLFSTPALFVYIWLGSILNGFLGVSQPFSAVYLLGAFYHGFQMGYSLLSRIRMKMFSKAGNLI